MAEEIALFPLDHVLLPGLPLPLHIFEPRYRQLVADMAAGPQPGHGSFGVVLGQVPAHQSSEPVTPLPGTAAGRPPGAPPVPGELAEIGTVAEILENEPYADGRCDLLTVGSRRFRILEVDRTSRPYLCASVEYLDEHVGTVAVGDLERTGRLTERYVDVLSEVSDAVFATASSDTTPVDTIRFSYEVAARMQLTTEERQMLLGLATAAERLTAEIALLRRELAIFGVVRAVPAPARALLVQAGAN